MKKEDLVTQLIEEIKSTASAVDRIQHLAVTGTRLSRLQKDVDKFSAAVRKLETIAEKL